MPVVSEYTNVYTTAVTVLEQAGFQVWYDEETELYGCERGGWDFMAESPVGLLGLVKLYETMAPEQYGEYWWRREDGTPFRELPRAPRPYVSVIERR